MKTDRKIPLESLSWYLIYICMCVCVCVHTHTHMYVYLNDWNCIHNLELLHQI